MQSLHHSIDATVFSSSKEEKRREEREFGREERRESLEGNEAESLEGKRGREKRQNHHHLPVYWHPLGIVTYITIRYIQGPIIPTYSTIHTVIIEVAGQRHGNPAFSSG